MKSVCLLLDWPCGFGKSKIWREKVIFITFFPKYIVSTLLRLLNLISHIYILYIYVYIHQYFYAEIILSLYQCLQYQFIAEEIVVASCFWLGNILLFLCICSLGHSSRLRSMDTVYKISGKLCYLTWIHVVLQGTLHLDFETRSLTDLKLTDSFRKIQESFNSASSVLDYEYMPPLLSFYTWVLRADLPTSVID